MAVERREQYIADLARARELNIRCSWRQAASLLIDIIGRVDQADILRLQALNARGESFRMLNDYVQAEQDFQQARILAQDSGNIEEELIALAGLIDLKRTGDRDPNYSKNMEEASELMEQALKLGELVPFGRYENVKASENFGLMELERGDNVWAMRFYNDAERGLDVLLTQDPENIMFLDRRARILHLKGVVWAQSVSRIDDAIWAQLDAHGRYTKLNDIRGIGNTALALGQIFQSQGNTENADYWYLKAFYASMDGQKILDPAIREQALAARESLSSSPGATQTQA